MDHHTAIPGQNMFASDRPQLITPIETTILSHHETVGDGVAKLEASQITVDSLDQAVAKFKVGDIILISVGAQDAVAADKVDIHIYCST